MKFMLQGTRLLLSLFVVLFSIQAHSQTLLAGWDFQTTANGGTAAAVSPNTPTSYTANVGSGTLYLNGTNGSGSWSQATELTSFAGSSFNVGTGMSNVTAGATSLTLLCTASSTGKAIVFKINMSGYKDLVISYVTQKSSTGFSSQQWAYSTDATNWINFGTAINPPTTWATQTLSTVTGLNNASTAYVRLTFSSYSGSSQNNRIDNVQFNATAIPAATLTPSPASLTGFNYVVGSGPSASQSFSLTGSNLTSGGGTITVTGSTNYEVSADNTTFDNTATINYSGTSLSATSVYLRLKNGLAAGTYNSETLSISGGGATASVSASGSVSAGSPSLSASTSSLSGFSTTSGTASDAQNFTVSGSNLTANVTVTAPTDYEVSTSAASGYAGSLTLTPAAGSLSSTTIYVRIRSAAAAGNPAGNVSITSTGASTQSVGLSGTVAPGPVITTSAASLSGFTTPMGTASASQTVTVTGTNLTAGISCSAPLGFEVSADGNNYSSNITLNASGGAVSATVYIRISSGATLPSPSGSLVLSSSGATAQNIALSGTVIMSYTWAGGSTGSITTSSNWSPQRTSPVNTDVLNFNDGTSVTVTGITSMTIGRLNITNNTTVTLQASAAATISINGSGNGFNVSSGSQLINTGASAISIALGSGVTGTVNGSISMNSAAHRLTASDASAIVVGNGGSVNLGSSFTGNPFGSTSLNSVIFASGSNLVQGGGSNPFGATAPNSVVIFQTGSLYKVTGASFSPSFSNRSYADVEFAGTGTATIAGSGAFSVNNFSVSSGTVNVTSTGTPGHSIKGNLSVASGATLSFSPSAAATYGLNGTSAQSLTVTGTLSATSNVTLQVNNASGISINSDVNFGSATLQLTNGIISTGNSTITTLNTNGGSSSSYVRTNGNGKLVLTSIGATAKTFVVGNSSYNPLTISNGSNLNWSVKVTDAVNNVLAPFNVNKAVQRTWDITPSGTPAGATLVFQYDESDPTQIGPAFSGTENIQVWHYDPVWIAAGSGAVPSGSVGGVRTVTLSGWTNFSPFALSTISGPLPVRFTQEKIKRKQGAAEITWTNETEQDLRIYTVERSENGRDYAAIQSLYARANNGQAVVYHARDAHPPDGLAWYRVRAEEWSGRTVFSRILALPAPATGSLVEIYPNPATGGNTNLRIAGARDGEAEVLIYLMDGMLISRITVMVVGGRAVLPAGCLPAKGFYPLHIRQDSRQWSTTVSRL